MICFGIVECRTVEFGFRIEIMDEFPSGHFRQKQGIDKTVPASAFPPWCRSERFRNVVIVARTVKLKSKRKLFHVGDAGDFSCCRTCLAQCRKQQGSQDCDDCNHDEEFYQCEFSSHTLFLFLLLLLYCIFRFLFGYRADGLSDPELPFRRTGGSPC